MKKNHTTEKPENDITPRAGKNFVPASNDAAADLRTLFIDALKDIYWAENALLGALPKMAENATAKSLAAAIKDHLAVTENQVIRLEEIFKLLGEKAAGKKCEAMSGLLKEGDSILKETIPGAVRDAGIIAASQKIEHYEIATYGTLCAFAKILGENEVVQLLTKTLAEEKEADALLNDVALSRINLIAAEGI